MLNRIDINFPVKKVGVISDTHVPRRAKFIPSKIFQLFDGVDIILHAGDLVDENVIRELETLAPVYAVAGNMDPPRLHSSLGEKKLLNIQGISVGIIHGFGTRHDLAPKVVNEFKGEKVDCIVFGHSHQPLNAKTGGLLLFNPGSPTDPRGGLSCSCGELYIERNRIKGKIHTWNVRT